MSKRILIIEDETDLRENTAILLELGGYSVDTAVNGIEGLQKALDSRPDLILCDIKMPMMDGLELVDEIRRTPELKTIPFIFFSAKTTPTDIRQGMNRGADDYLPKPFSNKDLLTAVANRLSRAKDLEETVQKQLFEAKAQIKTIAEHEYNTPLNGIIGNNYLISNHYDYMQKEDIISAAAEAVKVSWRLKHTLDNTLLSNLLLDKQRASLPVNYTTGSVSITADLIWTIIHSIMQRQDSEPKVDVEVEEADLPVSEDAFKKCLEELIDNAIKFSEADQRVVIQGSYNANRERYIISVHNKGRQFLASDIENIDAYRQFDRKTYEQQGQGLGLFIVKKLSEANRMQLHIESSADSGTRAQLYLPTKP